MARPNYGAANWGVNGPRALAWLAAEAPKRTSVKGLPGDCASALRLPVDGRRLADYLSDTKHEEWHAIKATLGKASGNGTRPHSPTGPSATSSPVPTRTLAEFLRDKRREGCPVCALSPEVRRCLAEASARGTAKVAEQVEWLVSDCGARVTAQELVAHRSGGHER